MSQAQPSAALESLPRVDAYADWQRDEGVPVVRGFYVPDLAGLELGPWPRKGGRGAFLNLEGTGGITDAHVVEIAPGASSERERHIYEALVYIVSGSGSTRVWSGAGRAADVEWGPGSLFALPLNAPYQLFNASGTHPARYVAVTNAPTIMSLFRDRDFVLRNPFTFEDRLSADGGHFAAEGRRYAGRTWMTNFVPDVRAVALTEWQERGRGSNLMLELGSSSMGAHISQFAVGTYKKAHRHGPGAHVVIVEGSGYSLLWKDGDAERRRCEWRPGAVVVPPAEWFHQHFNTGPRPARYLALRFSSRRFRQPANVARAGQPDQSVKLGGWQIEYEDEDPEIHREYERELAAHGARCAMRGLVPGCEGVTVPAAGGEDDE